MNPFRQRFLLTLLLLCGLTASAQHHFDAQAFEAEKQSNIVQQAHLTPEETRRFVPLYKEMVAKKRKIHGQLRQLRKQSADNERAARALIERRDNLEISMRQVERDYHLRMLKVMSAVKLKAALDAERKFHRMKFRKAARNGH